MLTASLRPLAQLVPRPALVSNPALLILHWGPPMLWRKHATLGSQRPSLTQCVSESPGVEQGLFAACYPCQESPDFVSVVTVELPLPTPIETPNASVRA